MSESRLLDAIPHGVWVIDAAGRVLSANARAAALPAPAVRGRAEAYELDQGPYRLHVAPAGGEPERWIVTATDVGRLAETEAVLEALERSAPAGFGFAFVDRRERLARVNDTLTEMTGVPRAQALGRPAAEALSALWRDLGVLHQRVRTSGTSTMGTVLTTPPAGADTGPRFWLVYGHPVRAGTQQVGVVLALVDVTERKHAQAFRSVLMDDMAEGLYMVDSAGRLTSLNRAAEEMTGWTEGELLGTSAHFMLHAAGRTGTQPDEEECSLRRIRKSGRAAQTVDEMFSRKDGTTFEVACSVAPLDVGADLPGAVVTFRDVSELRLAEVKERHDQKLESLGRLSAGLAHEINTPIQFVGDNTRFLADAYQEMLDLLLVYRECVPGGETGERARLAEEKADIEYLAAEIPAAVEQSLEGVERVASLVRAMKSFSYKDPTDQTLADLNEALQTTLTVARNEVKYVADVVLDLHDLPQVTCHLGDLNQVFLNLLVNAADALKDTGHRGEIRISSRVAGPNIEISFRDNGPGIPEEIQQSIFEPFFTTKEVGKGTGQGLALARAVLEKHEGSIDIISKPGAGAEFVLTLPISGRSEK